MHKRYLATGSLFAPCHTSHFHYFLTHEQVGLINSKNFSVATPQHGHIITQHNKKEGKVDNKVLHLCCSTDCEAQRRDRSQTKYVVSKSKYPIRYLKNMFQSEHSWHHKNWPSTPAFVYLGTNDDSLVYTYQCADGSLGLITSQQVLKWICNHVRAIGKVVLGFNVEDVSTHSIRSTVVMAMYLACNPVYTIMLIRHWSSNAFLAMLYPSPSPGI